MNSKKLNILIGKIGKAAKFTNIDIRSDTDTTLILYSTMARINPNFNFYFIGPNDLDKLSPEEYEYLFPNKNVYSAFNKQKVGTDLKFDTIVDYFTENNIHVDFALIFAGVASNVNIPNFSKTKAGTYSKPLMMFSNYAGPIIYTLNKINCPFYLISEDARHVLTNARDCCNTERMCFTQIETVLEKPAHYKSMDDYTMVSGEKVKCLYSEVEKIFLMGINKDWKSKIDIERKVNSKGEHLIVISNGHGTNKLNSSGNIPDNRLAEYKNWIIDFLKDTEYKNTKIYGKWSDHIYDEYPSIVNKRILEMDEEIADAKYTLIYSMIPGFVTIKPYEMIIKGIIPFIHPDYDKFNLLNLPKYCYIKDKQDFLNKMRELDANPEMYRKVLNECFNSIEPKYTDGSFINNFIFEKIGEDLGMKYEHQPGVENTIFDHFSKTIFDFENKPEIKSQVVALW